MCDKGARVDTGKTLNPKPQTLNPKPLTLNLNITADPLHYFHPKACVNSHVTRRAREAQTPWRIQKVEPQIERVLGFRVGFRV